MEHASVLLKPLISEKATILKEANNKVVFFVRPDANRVQIQAAVESVFKVTVKDVNIVNSKSRLRKRFGRTTGGRISGYKKAYVTLAQGDKIEFFEGV